MSTLAELEVCAGHNGLYFFKENMERNAKQKGASADVTVQRISPGHFFDTPADIEEAT